MKQPQLLTLKTIQQLVSQAEKERGFDHETVLKKCLLLGEEVGELFKAIRKSENIKVDDKSKIGSMEEELADILFMLCTIANRYNIDLTQAFITKEAVNKKREWKN